MIRQRLTDLRNAMKKSGIDMYYFNTSDYHMSEYVSEFFRTIYYFSGFSGSLATLLVTMDKAYIFVDGRYHAQADNQCLPNGIEVLKLGLKDVLEPVDFIKKKYPKAVVGLDGRRTSTSFAKSLIKNNIKIKSVDIYSDLIVDRTPLPKNQIWELALKYTGLMRYKKIDLINHYLNGACLVTTNLESIAYLTNLRSDDVKHTPVFMANLVIKKGVVYLFVDIKRLSVGALKHLCEDDVKIKPYDKFYEFLAKLDKQTILFDENKVNYEAYLKVCENNRIVNTRSIIEDMKAVKNECEQRNSRKAHEYDGVVMFRFINWLKSVEDKKQLNEYIVGEKLDEMRLNYKAFDLSFNSIVGYQENSAIMHYSATKDNYKYLDNKNIVLVDSGGQYKEGTTDITRTIACGKVTDEIKKSFTLVLKSMFNLSEVTFKKGTTGLMLDILARKDLYAEGLDFRHGTGHGVGHVLSVHENPPNIRNAHTEGGSENTPFKPGMIVSDEPGLYFDGKYGIRCENQLLCVNDVENEWGEFYKFETLTLVPFDLDLIDKKYLDEKTIKALNNYHQTVFERISPYLNEDEVEVLRKMTKAI